MNSNKKQEIANGNFFPKFYVIQFKKKKKTWIMHESEASICKAFKGAAIVDYCKPLITPQMEASDSPNGWKLGEKDNLAQFYRFSISSYLWFLCNTRSLWWIYKRK